MDGIICKKTGAIAQVSLNDFNDDAELMKANKNCFTDVTPAPKVLNTSISMVKRHATIRTIGA